VTQISAFSNQNVVHNVEQCRLLPASAPAPDLQHALRPAGTGPHAFHGPAPSLTSAAAIAAMRAVDSWPTSPALMSGAAP
jgi:hypothetical protein